MAKTASKTNDPSSRQMGEWTVMGIVKRLDDQKRMIDLMRQELHEFESKMLTDASKDEDSERLGQLAHNIETALAANKRLADSIIKIREVVSRLLKDNERLRQELGAITKASADVGLSARSTGRLSDAHIRIVRAVVGGPKSATEISRIVGRSREHISRMVSKIVELGVLQKESDAYPAKYTLTTIGREFLEAYEARSLLDDIVP